MPLNKEFKPNQLSYYGAFNFEFIVVLSIIMYAS